MLGESSFGLSATAFLSPSRSTQTTAGYGRALPVAFLSNSAPQSSSGRGQSAATKIERCLEHATPLRQPVAMNRPRLSHLAQDTRSPATALYCDFFDNWGRSDEMDRKSGDDIEGTEGIDDPFQDGVDEADGSGDKSETKKPTQGEMSGLDKMRENLDLTWKSLNDNWQRTQKNFQMGPNNFGNKKETEHKTGVTFEQVAGVDEAKLELSEVVDMLKFPERYSRLGAELPRGVLLEGPPGTGKTMLAKAVAHEADVPFFAEAGSGFVEMYVGLGAKRVRELFQQAEKNAPCIIFIDEFDAVGGKRSAGEPGRSDERDQTINELLTQMDGFDGAKGIIVIATTNRRDMLDEAVLRPGRFDRIVRVDLPDVDGREAILNVHAENKPMAEDVDLRKVAERTLGMSGAELKNLLNEGAILAARGDKLEISMEELDQAYEKVAVGLAKANHQISPQRKHLVAVHEAGHALVGAMLPNFDSIEKVSVVPRGPAGGLTWFRPSAEQVDSGLFSRDYLRSQLAVALGGRIAEEIVFGRGGITTGASNDLERVSQIVKNMVKVYGMSELPPRSYDSGSESLLTQLQSPERTKRLDEQEDKLVLEAVEVAKNILTENFDTLEAITNKLVESETLSAEEFLALIPNASHSAASYLADRGEGAAGERSGEVSGATTTDSRERDGKDSQDSTVSPISRKGSIGITHSYLDSIANLYHPNADR